MSPDPLSTSAMSHAELSSCRPISHEEVCSAWETETKLRSIHVYIL